MSKKDKVEVQKGPIKAQEDSYRMQTHQEKVRDAVEQNRMRRDYQSLHYFEPKK